MQQVLTVPVLADGDLTILNCLFTICVIAQMRLADIDRNRYCCTAIIKLHNDLRLKGPLEVIKPNINLFITVG